MWSFFQSLVKISAIMAAILVFTTCATCGACVAVSSYRVERRHLQTQETVQVSPEPIALEKK